jgi:hypothetical protein
MKSRIDSIGDAMTIPAPVKQAIKARAAMDWPDDYEMQAYTIEKQSEAYAKMVHYSALDMENEIFSNCFAKATREWPEDYTMQAYTFEKQAESAFSFFEYTNPAIPQDALEKIRIHAFSEWAGDYDMMLHTLEKQVTAWISINSD